MPIIYTTGTISQPDAGSVGLAMLQRIRDDVTAHEAWELVEEFAVASATVQWTVLRCRAFTAAGVPLSGLPADFFVVIGRTLSTGELRFSICETYSVAARQMQHYPVFGTSTAVAFDAEGRLPATFTLGASTFAATGGTTRYSAWVPSGTSTKWWITVADDGFTVAFNGPSNGFVHIGRYTPLAQLSITFPLQIVGSSAAEGGITRNPAVSGISAPTYALGILGASGTAGVGGSGARLGFGGDMRYNDKLQGARRAVSEFGMVMEANPFVADWMAVYGFALGKQRRIRLGAGAAPTGFAFGDAYSLEGRLWVPYLPTDLRIWDTGIASS